MTGRDLERTFQAQIARLASDLAPPTAIRSCGATVRGAIWPWQVPPAANGLQIGLRA